ncbi:hypothetical protein LJB89_00590, partial [Tyzzerella sp. OttesenSCG-928-J15]|nr:hypothetical protein [Tyzzerella sp. OttesenSCG-928-J15]
MKINTEFENGTIIANCTLESTQKVDFVPHKSFQGVSLKLLVCGDKTDNALSLHLVRVEPHCCLETHEHPQNLEIHKVVGGTGSAVIGGNSAEYRVGSIGVIPMGVSHKV